MSTPPLVAWKPKSRDPAIASARIRCLNILPELVARGCPITFFDEREAADCAAVIYSKLYDSATLHEAQALQQAGVRIVLDLCDNHFQVPDDQPALLKKADELRRMLNLADELVASTAALAEVMREELAAPKRITIIGDAVESSIILTTKDEASRHGAEAAWQELRRALDRAPLTPLVWFGLQGGPYAPSGMTDLLAQRDLLEALHRQFPLCLTVISNSRPKYKEFIQPWRIPTFYLEWNAVTFLPALQAHAISLIPITPSPFTRCKSNNRLALALHHGLAVVADTIPSYEPFREVACLGDWKRGLSRYLADPSARARDVAAARPLLTEQCSLAQVATQWQALIERLCHKQPVHADPSPVR